ncbi:Sensor histidine kinase RegB [Rubripirellula lacrimiformis]|uniref:histidine kinase n=1 Tax=Rubripirellula lacrimiformis TaxID=1930273 RepID=A0A517NJA4_9BACT|nr:ATP-binding protein [Rubripirellula lacrimiformis]QDT07216.1 Sensor histidine kinase RegB [Rubripirellula lacrimiformis]
MRASRDTLAIPLIAPAPLGSSKWLLHLRSFAIAGQLITILATWLLTDIQLPYGWLIGLVALTAVTNLVYQLWLRRQSPDDVFVRIDSPRPDSPPADSFTADSVAGSAIAGSSIAGDSPAIGQLDDEQGRRHAVAYGLMLLDLAMLTAMLHFSGGAGNPFSFFYFVNLAVGGVMIRPKAAWGLTATAVLGYTFLLLASQPIIGFASTSTGMLNLHAVGQMLAFSACATVVTYFVTRTAGQLKQREQQLLRAQAAQAASHRLEGLTTLAAGAAHELATPLSTIDVIVRELSRHLDACEKPESVDTDLRLIDAQLEMCRQILQRMRSAAGDSTAPHWDRTTVGDLIDTVLEGIRDPHRVDVTDGSDALEATPLWVPQEAVAQAVRNLIHNGLDASGDAGRVRLEPILVGQSLRLSVVDSGEGMTADVLGRASDPFFTTKDPGRGIGLGLFLTRNVISQLGGQLDFQSQPGVGTKVVVTIPLDNPRRDFKNGAVDDAAATF